jgi:hypothetical protein
MTYPAQRLHHKNAQNKKHPPSTALMSFSRALPMTQNCKELSDNLEHDIPLLTVQPLVQSEHLTLAFP